MVAHCHKLVAETAREMCHQLYDTMMQDNEWYKLWKQRWPKLNAKQLEGKFVAKNLTKMLPQARAALSAMLSNSSYDEKTKETIYEALLLDQELMLGRWSHKHKPATTLLH